MLQNYNLLFGIMESLGKKWVVPLLLFLMLYEEPSFNSIKKNLKLTSRALSRKLKMLETMGLIERITQYPRTVIYTLTEKGLEMSNLLLKFPALFSK